MLRDIQLCSIRFPCIVHLPHIHQLLSPGASNVFREFLTCECFDGSFHIVHRVSGPSAAGGEVGDTCATADFEDEMVCADAEAWKD
jgi:hypothetical protein